LGTSEARRLTLNPEKNLKTEIKNAREKKYFKETYSVIKRGGSPPSIEKECLGSQLKKGGRTPRGKCSRMRGHQCQTNKSGASVWLQTNDRRGHQTKKVYIPSVVHNSQPRARKCQEQDITKGGPPGPVLERAN